MKLFYSLLLTCLISLSLSARSLPDGIEYVRTLDDIEEYILTSNGLRVLLLPKEGLPVATVMVTYQVGARNEVAGTTGATHILEHMMFKGTERFNAAEGNDYSSEMERIGALANATTYFDRTNYYATLPRQYLPLAIELEADRMRNLRIREEDLASEMTVVRNEYERGENSPVRTLIKEMYATAFMAHPYSHPTIGWRSDIESTSPEKLRAFYDTFYWPENAVLTVIGGFDKYQTLEKVTEFYGAVPKAPKPIPQVTTVEPEQIGPRRLIIERAGQVGVVMTGFKVPEGTHEDWAALTLLQQILGADKTGRLYRALEDKGKASATFTFAPQLHDPCLFLFAAYLTPDATHADTEAILLDEIKKLITDGVTADELARAKSVIQASTVYARDGSYRVADELNEAIAMGDWTTYVTLPKAIQEVSADAVQSIAAKYFITKNSTTGWFVPKVTQTAALQQAAYDAPNYYRDPAIDGATQFEIVEASVVAEPASASVEIDFSSAMQQATVVGIEVIAIEMPIEQVVSFAGSLAAGDSLSPADSPALASLTAAMLDKGTLKNDRFAVAEKLDTLGAGMGFGAGAHSLEFSGKFLRNDAGAIMELLAEQLREPAFDAEVLETLKSRQAASLLQALDNPDYRASAEVSRLLYPEGHPNYTPPIQDLIEDIKNTSIEDIAGFHRRYYGPKSMQLVFAGDIDFEQLTAAVQNAFGDWEGGVNYRLDIPEQLKNTPQSERIQIADKTSVSVRYGYNTGLQRTDDDYLPFIVGNYILGGSFQSRLMTEIRKNQGLTYDIRATHQGDIMNPGNWLLSASFAPVMLEQGLQATDTVVNSWYEQGVSDEEVAAAIETLSGSYLVRLTTTASVAGQVLSFIQRGFDADYIDTYPNLLLGITSDQVNQTIRKYFDPKNCVQVVAGSLTPAVTQTITPKFAPETISVQLDTPDSGWRISIEKILQTSESLVVISQLSHSDEPNTQVITSVSDSAQVPKIGDLAVRHYILGKTWDWGVDNSYTFIDSMDVFGTSLTGAEVIYQKK